MVRLTSPEAVPPAPPAPPRAAPSLPESVRVLDLRPGDRLVLNFGDRRLTPENRAQLREHMSEFAPGAPVLILDCNTTLDVLRAQTAGNATETA